MGQSDWANLRAHLLDSVLERLESVLDYLQFIDVCMPWNRVAKDHRIRYKPVLLICSPKEDTWDVFDVMEDKVVDLQLRLPNRRFCGSSNGWLVTVDENFVVTLINPFPRVERYKETENSVIRLPPLCPRLPLPRTKAWAQKCEKFVYKAIISGDPILNASNCIIGVIYKELCQLAFIRFGKDTTWTYIDNLWEKRSPIEEVVHVGDRFYGVDHRGSFLTFGDLTEAFVEMALEPPRSQTRRPSLKRYLVYVNKNEVLMVARHANGIRNEVGLGGRHETFKFEVFELKLDTLKWVEKTTLGDAAIFVGENSSYYVPASKFSGCQPDCIYFTADHTQICWTVEDFGVYNMKTQQVNAAPYTQKVMALLRKTNQPPIWVVATGSTMKSLMDSIPWSILDSV